MVGSWFARGSKGSDELSFLFCGRRNCHPGEAVGPAVREHYLMHYCLAGRGVYRAQGVSYEIGPGEGFLILPGELSSYQADLEEPWSHIWVGFTGTKTAEYLKCCGLDHEHRTYQCAQPQRLEACVEAMMGFDTAGAGNELLLLGELYTFLGWVAQSAQSPARRSRETGLEYVEMAAEYIRKHFQEDLTVEQAGLERTFLRKPGQVKPELVEGELPLEMSFLAFEGDGIHMTAFKKGQKKDDLFVRFVNNMEHEEVLSFKKEDWMKEVYRSNVIEEKGDLMIPDKDGVYHVALREFEIATFGIVK